MKARRFLLALLLGLSAAAWARAAGTEGDLYLLGVALNQAGEPGGWVRVGPEAAWKNTRAAAILDNRLWTAGADGALRSAHLGSGERKQVGKAEFGSTALMFAAGDRLWTIEDGSLYRVDPKDGVRSRVGAAGAWKLARAGAVLGGRLYTAETDGTLRATDLAAGERKQVGKAEFASTTRLFAASGKLGALDADGGLFLVDPGEGGRARVGQAKAWKNVLAAGVFQGRLYTAESDGTLRETDLSTGARKQIGKAEFGNTAFLFAGGDAVYTIETDGSLYRVTVKPTESIDAFNWCPEEIEKVFREQGKGLHRVLQTRQILGKQATHAGVLDGLAWLRKNTTKKDLVVMYIGCHGFTDAREGWGVETADGKTLWGHEIKAELGKLPCQVLILIETCTSGGFAQAHKNDPPVPANVTALCACTGTQSTDNPLDIAVAEALYGRADFNKDGVVEVDELIRYVEQRYKELFPGAKKTDDNSDTPVIVKAKGLPGSLALTKPSPQLAAVVHNGAVWSALLEKRDGDKYRVHLLGWSSKPGPYFLTNSVNRDCICLPDEGAPLLVEQKGQWYPARLLSKDGGKYKVHYLGYNEDEVVTKERIKFPFVGRADEEKDPKKP